VVPDDWAEQQKAMAKRLHDEVASGLTALRWMLQGGLLDGPGAADAQACLQRLAAAVQEIEAELFPAQLLHDDLPGALQDLARRHGVTATEFSTNTGTWPDGHQAQCLYRVLAAALVATPCDGTGRMSLDIRSHFCELLVAPLPEPRDDAHPTAPAPWLCRERLSAWAAALGGTIEWRTETAWGQGLRLRLPVGPGLPRAS
jgi:hypothetical protein